MDRWWVIASVVLACTLSPAIAPAVATAQDPSEDCDSAYGADSWRVEVRSWSSAASSEESPGTIVRLTLAHDAPFGIPWGTLPDGLLVSADGALHGRTDDPAPQPIELDAGAVLIDETLIPPSYPLPGLIAFDVPEGATPAPATLLLVPGACGGERRAIALPAEGAASGPAPRSDPILGSPSALVVGPLRIEQVGTAYGLSCTSFGTPRTNMMAIPATIEFRVENRSGDPVTLRASGVVVDSAGARWPGFTVVGDGTIPADGMATIILGGDVSAEVDVGDCETLPEVAPGAMWAHLTFAIDAPDAPTGTAVFLLELPG